MRKFYEDVSNTELLGGSGRASDKALSSALKYIDDPTTAAEDVDRFKSQFSSVFNKKFTNVQSQIDKERKDLEREYANTQNRFDFSTAATGPTADDTARQQQAQAELQARIDKFNTSYGKLGATFETPGLVRTATGLDLAKGAAGKTAQGLNIRQAADGSFEIFNPVTNAVVEAGLKDTASALARQNVLQSGAESGLTGRADLTATPENLAAQQAGTLESGRVAQAKQNATTQGVKLATGDRLLNPDEFAKLRTDLGVGEGNFDQYFIRVTNPATGVDDIFLRAEALTTNPSFKADMPSETTDGGETVVGSAENIDLVGATMFDDSYAALLAGGASSPEAFVASLGALDGGLFSDSLSKLEQERQSMISQLEADTTALEGKGAAILKAEEDAGVNDMIKQLQELNLRIAQRTAAYDAGEAKIMDQAIPQDLLIGQSASLQRQEAVELGALYSQASALQGNITLAQDIAERTVNLMYADEEQRIANTQMFLEINSSDLSREEQKQAQKLQIALDERARILTEKKTDSTNTSNLLIELSSMGIDPGTLGISYSKSYEDNLSLAAPKIAEAANAPKQMTVKEMLDIQKAELELAKLQQEMGISSSGQLTQDQLTKLDQTTEVKAIKNAQLLERALSNYKGLVEQYGAASFLQPAQQQQLASAYAEVATAWKDLKGLGALTGPDLAILEQAIPDVTKPGSGASILGVDIGIRTGRAKNALTTMENSLNALKADTAIQYNNLLQRNPAYIGSDYVQGLAGDTIDAKSFLNLRGYDSNEYDSLFQELGSDSAIVRTILQLESQSFNSGVSSPLNSSALTSDSTELRSSLPEEFGTLSTTFGSGTVTGYGSKFWKPGLDFVLPGGKDADVKLNVPVTVIAAKPGDNGGFGNQVQVRTPDGKTLWISHLDKINVSTGQTLAAGISLGKQGNTGKTYGKTGIHLDLTMPKEGGGYYTAEQVAAYLKTIS